MDSLHSWPSFHLLLEMVEGLDVRIHIIMDRRSWLRLVFFAPFSSNARREFNFVKNIWIERKSSFLRMWPLNLLRLKAILRWQSKVCYILSSFSHYYAHSKISLMVQKQSYPVVWVYNNSRATTIKLWYDAHFKSGGFQLRYEIDDCSELKAQDLLLRSQSDFEIL